MNREMRTVRLIIAIILYLGLAPTAVRSELTVPLDPLAPWDYEAMFAPAAGALHKQHQARDLRYRLLAWHVMENDRGLKVEAGLLWFSYRKAGVESWALADVYRHPHRDSAWQLSYVTDTLWEPVKVFVVKPTNKDVYEFGRQHWSFGAPPVFFRYLAAHVCEHAWLDAIGNAPQERYPSERVAPGRSHQQPNYRLNPTVRTVTRLAGAASRAPVRPAG
jgi:hypothetical protein